MDEVVTFFTGFTLFLFVRLLLAVEATAAGTFVLTFLSLSFDVVEGVGDSVEVLVLFGLDLCFDFSLDAECFDDFPEDFSAGAGVVEVALTSFLVVPTVVELTPCACLF